jgi:long-chain acyl-CoA synthetase
MHRNSVEWVVFEQAAISTGLVVVPIYHLDTPGNAAYIVANSDSRLLLLGENRKWKDLQLHHDQFPELKTVLTLDQVPESAGTINAYHAPQWLQENVAASHRVDLDPDALASIVYTSGTTGRPKGVMLSHHNILSNSVAISGAVPAYREDIFFSFLPLSHMLERTGGYYYPMMVGSEVVFSRSMESLASDIKTVCPTVLISVPRLFERMYTRIESELDRKGTLAQQLYKLTKEIGWHRFQWLQGREPTPPWWKRMLWPLLNALVGKKILSHLGGRLRVTISAGGRLDENVAQCFLGLGLPLLQGYGLTEASPAVCGNRADDNIPESVGPPLPGVNVRLGENNELMVGGPGVMLGYWKRPDATEQAIDTDGWLRTGDIAEITDGKVYIRGRIKDILVTSTGEKVPRSDLESAIGHDPLFEQVVVVGEGKPYLAALIVLNDEIWQTQTKALGLDPLDPATLHARKVRDTVLARIKIQLAEFPSYARIRKVHLTLEPWTVENELMTATQKLRRTQIIERFKESIDGLYSGH